MKFVKGILAAIMVSVMAFALFGCTQGESVYDIAKRNGFSGTEKEWLESLKGEKGDKGENGIDGADGKDGQNFNLGYTMTNLYEEAKKNGYTGEFVDFVKEVSGGNATDIVPVINKGLFSTVNIIAEYSDDYGVDSSTDNSASSSSSSLPEEASSTHKSGGSGIIYEINKESGSAIIITNFHVIYNSGARTENKICEILNVYLYGDLYFNRPIKAKFVGGSANYDIAVLRIEASEEIKNSYCMAMELGNSDSIRIGDKIMAIGNPGTDGSSVTFGNINVASEVISLADARGENVSMNVIRYDATVNPGNSGGALIDYDGKLVGIVNAKLVKSKFENTGYAIPVNFAKLVVENILKYCSSGAYETVYKPMLGITVELVDSTISYDKNSEVITLTDVIAVKEISKDSKTKAIFNVGDVIVGVTHLPGGKIENKIYYPVTKLHTISNLLLTVSPGDELHFSLLRNGISTTIRLQVTYELMQPVK